MNYIKFLGFFCLNIIVMVFKCHFIVNHMSQVDVLLLALHKMYNLKFPNNLSKVTSL